MPHMVILGLGYTGSRLADRLRRIGWTVTGVRRIAGQDAVAFHDREMVEAALASATHILSSVPPSEEGDPILNSYGALIASVRAQWTGYFSSTGVYGDAEGAWVDEATIFGNGRRRSRMEADQNWRDLREDMRCFRLPAIYGPGRSALDRVREGAAHRIDMVGQTFSRIHVDDIVGGVIASFDGPAGVYNLADDHPCAQNDVVEAACDLLGVSYPPLRPLNECGLSTQALAFYSESRRVANGRAKRVLGWKLQYPTFREGLKACL